MPLPAGNLLTDANPSVSKLEHVVEIHADLSRGMRERLRAEAIG